MTTYEVDGMAVDLNFIVLCKEHGSAIGPFPSIDNALDYIEVLVEVKEQEHEELTCMFDVIPMMPVVGGVESSSNSDEPWGYL